MKKLIISTLVTMATFNAHAMTEGPQWNSVDFGYAKMNIDGSESDSESLDPAGFKLQGEYLLTDNIFLAGKYSSVSDDFDSFIGKVDTTINELRIGAGYRYPINERFDVYGLASYYNQETEFESGFGDDSADIDGFALSVGGKYALTSKAEVFGQISTLQLDSDIDEDDPSVDNSISETEFEIGGRYKVNDDFAVSVSYVSLDDFSVFSFGGAYYF